MVVSCCVIGCSSRFNKENPGRFYRIPKKPDDHRIRWISAIKLVASVGNGGTANFNSKPEIGKFCVVCKI